MIQTKDGKFTQSDLTVSSRMKATEETDAVFFDANNDGGLTCMLPAGVMNMMMETLPLLIIYI